MKRRQTLLVLFVAVVAAALIGVATPQVNAQGRRPGGAGPAAKAERFVVVQIGDDLEVMTTVDLTAKKKALKEQYKEEMAKFNQAKKEAAKKKEKFEGEKPIKIEPKQIGTTFKTREEAEAFCEKKRQEREGKGDAGSPKSGKKQEKSG